MNILVTGGAGFIGSHITDRYLQEGHRVVVLDNLSSGKRQQVPPQAVFYKMDLMDPEVERIFEKEAIEVINHHAAQISVTQAVKEPDFDANINIVGTLKLLNRAVGHGVKKFIFASTGGALYGNQEQYPAPEDHPCRPMSPYGISKWTVEQYLRFFQASYPIAAVIFRYSNVYGPRQDPHGEAGVIAIFSQKLIQGQSPVIFGDGKQTRDFISVFDVVVANVIALDSSCQGTFNISTGQETSVNHLTGILTGISGKDIATQYAPPRSGEVQRSSVDSRKFQEKFQWQPSRTLEQGLSETFEYFANTRRALKT